MKKALVALDTDHIKEYVFGTSKLKEIRGASSLLDYLNRIVMKERARSGSFDERCVIYANGGSGLFLIDADKVDEFGKAVQKAFRDVTGGGASITYVVQELPPDAPDDIDDILNYPLADTLALMRYRLREAKDCPPEVIALPSHPFMRLCDACGIEYANPDPKNEEVPRDPGEEDELYCTSCQNKRIRDNEVKGFIPGIERGHHTPDREYLWDHVISALRNEGYFRSFEKNLPERPHDFNAFQNFRGAKDYLGLIYADANRMGERVEACNTLAELKTLAGNVDKAIYEAVRIAIVKHLKIEDHIKPGKELMQDSEQPIFPFDILLLGGDDMFMVTPASVAMDVALTITTEFRRLTNEKHTLSVGVVLAPVKYPFGLSQDLADSTLKFAKKDGAKGRGRAADKDKYDDTRINFVVMAGNMGHEFRKVYRSLHDKRGGVSGHKKNVDFYATLRPYDPEQLDFLLGVIRKGHELGLGRTKLHQIREAVLNKNLTTSVADGLAVLRNWKERQRVFVVRQVYTFGDRYQSLRSDPEEPATMFPRVTFPWFADGDDMYRTPLLDFVELYDFVAREEGDSDNKG